MREPVLLNTRETKAASLGWEALRPTRQVINADALISCCSRFSLSKADSRTGPLSRECSCIESITVVSGSTCTRFAHNQPVSGRRLAFLGPATSRRDLPVKWYRSSVSVRSVPILTSGSQDRPLALCG